MNLVFIEDQNGNKVLPITSFSSVRDTNGNNLNLVLATKINSSEKGLNNGIATLDNSGKIPSSLISIDSTPTNNSDNPIKSGAVYEALEGKQDTIDNNHKLDADLVDDTNSTNKFTNSTEKGTWNGKQNKITANGLLKGDGNGGIDAATAGTDYVVPVSGKGLSTNDYDAGAKDKVDAIPNNPEYTDTKVTSVDNHYKPTSDPTKLTVGIYKVKIDAAGHITEATAIEKSDITGLGIPGSDTNTTYKLTIGSTTNGDTVNGTSLGTLESKQASSGGTDLSLVTTGEKDNWNNKLNKPLNVTYALLKALRDSGELEAGRLYRITDYVTTVGSQITNARSAGHRFDLVVLATSSNTIAEEAQAVKHEYPSDYIPSDTSAPDYQEKYDEVHYFDNVPMERWKIEYCLDNDTSKFEWACDDDYTFINITSNPAPYNEHLLRYAAGDAEDAAYPYCWGDSFFHVFTASETPAVGDTAYGASDGTGNEYTLNSVREIAGKGVIYHMIDDNNNDIPYDFKNIQFMRHSLTGRTGLVTDASMREQATYDAEAVQAMATIAALLGTGISSSNYGYYYAMVTDNAVLGSTLTSSYVDYQGNAATIDAEAYYMPMYYVNSKYIYCKCSEAVYLFTFHFRTNNVDRSLTDKKVNDNVIRPYFNSGKRTLNNNVFMFYDMSNYDTYGNSFGFNCYNNTFSQQTYLNTFGTGVFNNTFGNDVRYNTFGNNMYRNTFGNTVYRNTFGNAVYRNTFGNEVAYNTFGSSVFLNTFGTGVFYNTFGNAVYRNTFGNEVAYNTFGNEVEYNTFGNYVYGNTFGNVVQYVVYGQSVMSLGSYFYYNIIENFNRYLLIDCTQTTSSSIRCQNIKVSQGVNNTTTQKTITVDVVGQDYQIEFKPINSEIRNV